MSEQSTNTTSRCAIYTRSARKQSGSTVATSQQELACREYAAAHQLAVAEGNVYEDNGFTGLTMSERPGLANLKASMSEVGRPFDTLLVADPSPLGRHMTDVLEFVAFARSCGVRIVAADGALDSVDAYCLLQQALCASIEAQYVRSLKDRVNAARTPVK